MGICESHAQDNVEKYQDSQQSVAIQCYNISQNNRNKVPVLNPATQNSLYFKRSIKGPNITFEDVPQIYQL
ncbi:unnamed protein product [Paramecium sonneborni]|uniref:Uncharacterized protein n=1 Tax=Paramecium sonneborni TaxID=65129 RepID=A0A8S1R6L2_9CILI|nr:unnamed protein product [Paramecium sonneborni]